MPGRFPQIAAPGPLGEVVNAATGVFYARNNPVRLCTASGCSAQQAARPLRVPTTSLNDVPDSSSHLAKCSVSIPKLANDHWMRVTFAQSETRGDIVGAILGILVGIGVVVAAANGTLEPWSIGAAVVLVLVGLVFPRTIGMMLTAVAFASVVAIIVGLVTGHGGSAISALLIGVVSFAGQFIIGLVRRDSTDFGY